MIQKSMKQVGKIFGAPIVIEGRTWFPLVQLITWGIMTWLAGRQKKHRKPIERMAVGAITMPVVLGSEWGHNLAHAAIANRIGKPADGFMVIGGMPRLIYQDINDCTVSPKQHTVRALGGPVFNLGLLLLALFFRHLSPPNSLRREVADVAVRVERLYRFYSSAAHPLHRRWSDPEMVVGASWSGSIASRRYRS